jgi:ABC-type transport system involved in multi-copper enzyme maturation permease subunit
MAMYAISIDFSLFMRVLLMELAFCLAGFGLVMLLSAVIERGKATGVAIGLFLGMYFLNALSALNEKFEMLEYLSLFHYADFVTVFHTNVLDLGNMLVLLVVAVISTGLSVVVFDRRDI